jgi:hypothetical protein
MIDFVLPCHPKDFSSLKLSIDGVKRITGCGKIFVISKESPEIDGVVHIPESRFDVFTTKDKIENIWNNKNANVSYRSRWLYQQFLKILCFKVIEDLTESFVMVDSDTIFLRDVSFDPMSFQYSIAPDYHIPYEHPIKSLLGIETLGYSCINHHMIFNKSKLQLMIDDVEKRFNTNFIDAVLSIIDYNEASCFSEWDLYANYMIKNHPNYCVHRQLKWVDIGYIPNKSQIKSLNEETDYDFVSCHAYIRGIEQ